MGLDVKEDGTIVNLDTGNILFPIKRKCGYNVINYKKKTYYVHRLVAEKFCENTNNYKQVNHFDDNKDNNNKENLYWGNQSQNLKDCYRNGYKSIRNKKILKFNKKNVFIEEYSSIRNAALINNIKERSISNNLIGLSKSSGGFIWKYKLKMEGEAKPH